MARYGGFKNNAEFDAFIRRLQDRNRYDGFDEHLNIIEVVASSLLGRQNPLELKDAGFGETELVLSVTDHTDWTYNLDFPGFDIENVYDEDDETHPTDYRIYKFRCRV